MPSQYILIEGIPGAGKTTAIAALLARPDVCLIPDLANPKAVPAAFSLRWTFVLEAECLKSSLSRCTTSAFVLQERGFLSVLAYHFAEDELTGTITYPAVAAAVERAVAEQRLVIPHRINVIDVATPTSVTRQPGVHYDAWKTPDVLDAIRTFYHRYAERPWFGETVRLRDATASPREWDYAWLLADLDPALTDCGKGCDAR